MFCAIDGRVARGTCGRVESSPRPVSMLVLLPRPALVMVLSHLHAPDSCEEILPMPRTDAVADCEAFVQEAFRGWLTRSVVSAIGWFSDCRRRVAPELIPEGMAADARTWQCFRVGRDTLHAQTNEWDCGVFATRDMEAGALGARFSHQQNDIPHMRRVRALEMRRGRLSSALVHTNNGPHDDPADLLHTTPTATCDASSWGLYPIGTRFETKGVAIRRLQVALERVGRQPSRRAVGS